MARVCPVLCALSHTRGAPRSDVDAGDGWLHLSDDYAYESIIMAKFNLKRYGYAASCAPHHTCSVCALLRTYRVRNAVLLFYYNIIVCSFTRPGRACYLS